MVQLAALITGSRARAEEISHEAFVAVLERWDSLSNPGGYLRTIIVRQAIRARDRHRRDQETAILSTTGQSGLSVDPDVDDMWAALGKLPIKQRAALVLRFYKDYSYEQIAAALRCPAATARTLARRGLIALRKDMDQWTTEP